MSQPPPWWRLVLLAAPATPMSALALPLFIFLPPFYASDMGVGLALSGAIFLAARIFDMVIDPLVGFVSDRLSARLGGRKLLLGLAVPPVVVGVWALFFPPEGAGAAWLMGWLLVVYIGYTFGNVAQYAWAGELVEDYHQRSGIMAYIQGAIAIGTLGATAVIAQAQFSGADMARQVANVGWIIIILFPLTVLGAILGVADSSAIKRSTASFVTGAKALLKNKALRGILLADFLWGLPFGIASALVVFVTTDVWQIPQASGILILTFSVVSILGIPLWVAINKRVEKHLCLAAACLYAAAMTLCFLLIPAGQPVVAAAIVGLSGIAYGGGMLMIRSITADIVDQDLVDTGEIRSGLLFALITMTSKVGLAVAVGVAYPVLELIGYRPGAENAPAIIDGLMAVYVGAPVVAYGAIALLMWRFPLTARRQKELRAIIDQAG